MIVIGDIKGIRENMDFFKTANRMTHNYWSFDVMLSKIRNKSEENGIELKLVTEEYTSTTCPICGNCDKESVDDRSFICTKCSYSHHRDLVGSRNIMLKGMRGLIRSHWDEVVPLEAESGI
jgi:putative transposase